MPRGFPAAAPAAQASSLPVAGQPWARGPESRLQRLGRPGPAGPGGCAHSTGTFSPSSAPCSSAMRPTACSSALQKALVAWRELCPGGRLGLLHPNILTLVDFGGYCSRLPEQQHPTGEVRPLHTWAKGLPPPLQARALNGVPSGA